MVTKEKFNGFIEKYDSKDLNQNIFFENLIEKYPYFNLPYTFLSKSYKVQNNANYNKQLNKTSIRTFDRKILFEWIEYELPKYNSVTFKDKKISPFQKETKIVDPFDYKKWADAMQNIVENINELTTNTTSENIEGENEKEELEGISSFIKKELYDLNHKINEIKTNSLYFPITINNNEKSSSTNQNSQTPINNTIENESSPVVKIDSKENEELNKKKREIENASEKATEIINKIKKESTSFQKKKITPNFEITKNFNSLNEKQIHLDDKITLINKFIETNPKIKTLNPTKDNTKPKNIEFKNKFNKDKLMTETLANLYVNQKKYDEAKTAYNILSLKYPKKNTFFANKIKEIEKLTN